MIIAFLAVLGLCLGSFVNALVYRLRWQETTSKPSDKYSILKGRSICPNCKHELVAKDLIPVISWLLLKARCRYCKKPISAQYPLIEVATAVLFIVSYLFWPDELYGPGVAVFVVWLGILVGLIALAVYDLRWMILPNKIIFPLFGLAFALIILRAAGQPEYNAVSAVWGFFIGGGIFYVLFQVSDGKWIGGGDVKLGFLLGTITGGAVPAFIMLFLASLLGSLFSVPLILKGRLGAKAKIAFGPFLILSTIIVVLFSGHIIELYNNLLML